MPPMAGDERGLVKPHTSLQMGMGPGVWGRAIHGGFLLGHLLCSTVGLARLVSSLQDPPPTLHCLGCNHNGSQGCCCQGWPCGGLEALPAGNPADATGTGQALLPPTVTGQLSPVPCLKTSLCSSSLCADLAGLVLAAPSPNTCCCSGVTTNQPKASWTG